MSEPARHDLEELHQSLVSGKLPRNLSWSDAITLIAHLGTVEPHGGDEFAFVVESQRAFFKRPHSHQLGVEEVSRLRKLLKDAWPESMAPTPAQPKRMVVVIDHHAAHIYQETGASEPQAEATVKPYDPFGFHHHLVHRKEAHYKGERVPEENSFYEEIAQHLVPSVEIVLIGHGTGTSNVADHLAEFLKAHHPDLAKRITANETADLSALTQPEIEAIARRHMIAVL